MKKETNLSKISYYIAIFGLLAITACGYSDAGSFNKTSDLVSPNTGFIVKKAGMYDSADVGAILVKKNAESKNVTFLNNRLGKTYTLNYDGTSKIYDKYGTGMSMEQVKPGCVVDITFVKSDKLLNSMAMSADAWTYDKIDNFSIDSQISQMNINGSNYQITDKTLVYSDGKAATLMDINPVDTISVCGLDSNVASITIDEGHGYLRLKNEDYFVGGWIEIGSKIIKTVSEDMLIAVPIGTYNVKLSNKGSEGIKEVTISKNQETTLDVGDIKAEELATYGTVIIVTTPEKAEVYIDGEEIDTSKPQQLEYGIHQLIAKASGYQTLTQYIKVGQESATLEITLDGEIAPITPTPKVEEIPEPSPTPIPVPTAAPSSDVASVDGYKVTVSTPVDVEVYVDGNYVGIAPISFAKYSGSHEITLRKEGYVTRSYTISIDKASRDENFSFSDLVKDEEDDDEDDDD